MKIAALVSGGKDSIFSVLKLIDLNYSISHFICIIPKNLNSYMFHSINNDIVKSIAYSCGIPLIYKVTSGIKEKELNDLNNVILKIKDKYNIDGICSGAIQSNYQKKRIDDICSSLDLISFTPLWNSNLNTLLNQMIKSMDIRIVSVCAEGFDISWLGKRIDLDLINKLNFLNRKYGINIVGEGGEFETIVLDSPLYKYKIEILESKKRWFTNYGNYYISKVIFKNK